MKIAVLGYGSQGKSAYDYWLKAGNDLTVHDSREDLDLPENTMSVLGDNYLNNLDGYDLIVRAAPIIHPREIVAANPDSPDILNKVTSNTNEFMRVCPSKNIIGVTGTKGKGTTSTLIARMLEAFGYRVHLGGNIGTPPLELLDNDIKPEDWVVLELANFQLIDLKTSPHIAVCLMVVPEHLDWHEDMEEYIAAKQQLFINQGEDDLAIYFAENENSESVASASLGTLIPYFAEPGAIVKNNKVIIGNSEICNVNEIALLGKHNWQNVCAAVTAVWQIGHDVKALNAVIKSYAGGEFRLQFVREFKGVKFYNDSFGTTPETAIVAIKSFKEPKVLILGGGQKKSDYSELAKTISNSNVRKVILIGNTANAEHPTASHLISKVLAIHGFNKILDLSSSNDRTMDKIVHHCLLEAESGDVVLLSTACTSFDMFDNYKQRGELFNEAVLKLV